MKVSILGCDFCLKVLHARNTSSFNDDFERKKKSD